MQLSSVPAGMRISMMSEFPKLEARANLESMRSFSNGRKRSDWGKQKDEKEYSHSA
jgi:hypothetical protein